MDRLIIVGAGDHARVAIETARALGIQVLALIEPDGDRNVTSRVVAGVVVTTDLQAVAEESAGFIVSIGQNRTRAELFEQALERGGRPATLLHPTALLLGDATLGEGSHVCAGAVIGVDARIGRNVIVNTAASIDHDNDIGDHSFIGPNATLAGRVRVADGVHIGIGSTVIEARRIGAWALVAAGATVITDVPAGGRFAGTPARPMSSDRHKEAAND